MKHGLLICTVLALPLALLAGVDRPSHAQTQGTGVSEFPYDPRSEQSVVPPKVKELYQRLFGGSSRSAPNRPATKPSESPAARTASRRPQTHSPRPAVLPSVQETLRALRPGTGSILSGRGETPPSEATAKKPSLSDAARSSGKSKTASNPAPQQQAAPAKSERLPSVRPPQVPIDSQVENKPLRPTSPREVKIPLQVGSQRRPTTNGPSRNVPATIQTHNVQVPIARPSPASATRQATSGRHRQVEPQRLSLGTDKYRHIDPEHLADAVRYGPVFRDGHGQAPAAEEPASDDMADEPGIRLRDQTRPKAEAQAASISSAPELITVSPDRLASVRRVEPTAGWAAPASLREAARRKIPVSRFASSLNVVRVLYTVTSDAPHTRQVALSRPQPRPTEASRSAGAPQQQPTPIASQQPTRSNSGAASEPTVSTLAQPTPLRAEQRPSPKWTNPLLALVQPSRTGNSNSQPATSKPAETEATRGNRASSSTPRPTPTADSGSTQVAGKVVQIDHEHGRVMLQLSGDVVPPAGSQVQVYHKMLFRRTLVGQMQVIASNDGRAWARPIGGLGMGEVARGHQVAVIISGARR